MNYVILLLATLASFGRMLVAYIISLLVALSLGIAMARRRYVEEILMPILDVLQSIPILGFFPIVIVIFLSFLPKGIGLELSAVFLLITSLLWNMIFGVYSAIKSLDPEIFQMAGVYRLGTFARLFFIYIPAARGAIAANSIISWAGGWFFLTSAEVIASGSEEYKLLGLGSLIMDLYSKGDALDLYIAVALLCTIIMLSYILIFNPATNIVVQGVKIASITKAYYPLHKAVSTIWSTLMWLGIKAESKRSGVAKASIAPLFIAVPATIALLSASVNLGTEQLSFITTFSWNFLLSLTRVCAVIMLEFFIAILMAYLSIVKGQSSVIILAGEILASIPAIIWWPLLSPIITSMPWLVSLIIFIQGSLWYEFFNVMLFGVPKIRKELLELASIYGIKGLNYFKYIFIPSLLPSIMAGALSAWGGAWNATIVAEYFGLGDNTIDLGGIGALLNKYVNQGDFTHIVWTVILWALLIATINKLIWSRLFKSIEKTYIVE